MSKHQQFNYLWLPKPPSSFPCSAVVTAESDCSGRRSFHPLKNVLGSHVPSVERAPLRPRGPVKGSSGRGVGSTSPGWCYQGPPLDREMGMGRTGERRGSVPPGLHGRARSLTRKLGSASRPGVPRPSFFHVERHLPLCSRKIRNNICVR